MINRIEQFSGLAIGPVRDMEEIRRYLKHMTGPKARRHGQDF